MCKNLIIGRYIPENSIETIQEETNHVVYTYEKADGTPVVIAYGGKRKKPDFHFRYRTVEERTAKINKYFEERLNIKKQNDEHKANKKKLQEETFKNIKVDDIFHCGWGYEQTQCDFYQLVSLKGKTGTFRAIASKTVEGSQGHDCENQLADIGNFLNEEPFTKRLSGDTFKISSFQYVSKVENPETESFYCSWYY